MTVVALPAEEYDENVSVNSFTGVQQDKERRQKPRNKVNSNQLIQIILC